MIEDPFKDTKESGNEEHPEDNSQQIEKFITFLKNSRVSNFSGFGIEVTFFKNEEVPVEESKNRRSIELPDYYDEIMRPKPISDVL